MCSKNNKYSAELIKRQIVFSFGHSDRVWSPEYLCLPPYWTLAPTQELHQLSHPEWHKSVSCVWVIRPGFPYFWEKPTAFSEMMIWLLRALDWRWCLTWQDSASQLIAALTNPDASHRPSNKNTQSRKDGVNLLFFLFSFRKCSGFSVVKTSRHQAKQI